MSLLDNISLLSSLTQEQKQQLSIFCQSRSLRKWEVLFYQWDESTAMYFLIEWSVSIDADINGVEKHLWQAHAEEIIGEMSLLWDVNTRMARVTALEDCQLITILSFSVQEMTQKNPELLESIKGIIALRNIQNKAKGIEENI